MESHPRISELLVKTEAYKDLDEPVILTSGELGIYYINTEKLVQDGGEWKKYGEDSRAMIEHAIKMMCEHPTFGEVIDILVEKAVTLLKEKKPSDKFNKYTISGGQRRDWLFSGPVAAQLNLTHVSVYKDGKIEVIPPCGDSNPSLENTLNLHISDLLTEASSCYRKEDGEEKGWIPWVRKEGAEIRNLLAVVTRLQGGEERLKEIGVTVHPFVAIDENFLKQHSKYPERVLAYIQNPRQWSENYLRENGALALTETFNPDGGKLDRAKKFLGRYGNVLVKTDKWDGLDSEVNKRYNVHLEQISGNVD